MDVEQGRGAVVEAAPVPLQYEEWLGELRRYVHRLTGDHDVAEDVAQEALVKFVAANDVRPIEQPRGWLYRTATNLVRDSARHEAMKQRRRPPAEADEPATPEEDLERAEKIRRVRQVLERIPPRDRELLILRESGFKYREIAEVIGVKPDSVSVLAARALERFRVAYEMEWST